MKLHAHIPTLGVSARDWRVATAALVSVLGASMLMLAIQFGVLLDNPLIDRLRTLPAAHPDISAAHRVSLDIHFLSNPISPSGQFSVAHPLPADVTWPQRFSVGADARLAFEVFGEAAHRDMRANEKTVHQFEPRSDPMLLMWMLLRLHPHRS
jgi:hypothetical protein